MLSKNNEIIITRNEYLTSQKYKDKYFIYFWTNDNNDKPKKIIDFDFISKYVPKDTTKSKWSTARLIVD